MKKTARERARRAAQATAASQQQGANAAPDALDATTPTEALASIDEDAQDGNAFDSAMLAEQRLAAEEQRQAQLDAFASALAKKRKTAVESRRASGIEEIWREDEEFYEGVDDANRGEHVTTLKPRDLGGTGGSSVTETEAATGSTVFLNITRPYVDFSAGRAADMLLPTDDPNWDLKETPMPDVIQAFGDNRPLPADVATPQMTTIGQAAQQMVAEAKQKVDKAKKRIGDWLEEGQFASEQRKQLKDAAKVGVGILKGPFPMKSVSRAIVRGEDGSITMQVQNKTAPVSKRINYWNFYPDPSCGDDIHKGNYVWEKDSITARQLRDLMGTEDADGAPLYIESAIKRCLEEGPQRRFEDDPHYNAPDAENFEIWYYQGVATTEDLIAAGVDAEPGKVLPVIITMVNDRVIKAALSTLDSGDFTYDVMVWQPREEHWAGIGVARQVRAPQRILNGGIRNIMDNAGLGGGPQIVMLKGAVRPMAKGAKYGIKPRQMWDVDKDSGVDDVRKAFAAIEIPMVTPELMTIVQFALKMAEDVTGMPMLLQGQQGQASETVGGMQILTNNSNTPLRAIAKLFDDRVTVPHLLRYYEWLLLYGPAEDEKGEFIVAARGSSALFERDAQNQAILQMAQIVGDPKYRIDPEKWFTQYLRAQRLDPANFQYSDSEWAKIQQEQQQTPPPVDPKVQAAQIGAQARVQVAQIGAGVQQEKINRDADRDAIFAQQEAARTEADKEAKQAELSQQLQLAYLDYANKRNISLDQVKAELANTSMKLQVQRELSDMSAQIELHKHHNPAPTVAPASPQALTPPTEPAGRAPVGEAWQA